MKIILNGEEKVSKGKNILELLDEFKLPPIMVAVELNGIIIKRENFSSTGINNDDKIEIVRMMGGG